MYKKKLLIVLLSIASLVTFTACDLDKGNEKDDITKKLSIVTTFYPMYEFTKEVAGDRADISMLMTPGTDVHGFEPSAKDVATINEADIFIYSSSAMETWVGSLMYSLDSENPIVVRSANNSEFIQSENSQKNQNSVITENDGNIFIEEDVPETIEVKGLSGHYHTGDVVQLVAEPKENVSSDKFQWYIKTDQGNWVAVEDARFDKFEYTTTGKNFETKVVLYNSKGEQLEKSKSISVIIDDHNGLDPHVWLDPVLAQDQVDRIKAALIQADPAGKSYYEKNAQLFNSELQKLDQEYQAAFDSADKRVFIVQHQAFGYIAKRYGLEQVSVGGLSTEIEPTASRISEITNLMKKYDLPIIYYQHGENSSIAKTIAQETGTDIEVLYDLEGITQDMQDQGVDYITLMRKNLQALKLSVN